MRSCLWAPAAFRPLYPSPSPLVSFFVQCELPNARLYTFDGAVVPHNVDLSQRHPLTSDNLLLRGCTLRKTDWAVRDGDRRG